MTDKQADRVEPKTVGQRAYENMRAYNDGDGMKSADYTPWSRLSLDERNKWERDAEERPQLYGLDRVEPQEAVIPPEGAALLPFMINHEDSETGRRSRGHTVHGHTLNGTYSPTYHSWQAMLSRVRYINRDVDKKHIGRGITIADRWQTFTLFLQDMGERPIGTTLDRIDNDRNYEPGNCRWATHVDQARNRRNARLDYDAAYAVCRRMLSGETARSVSDDYGCSESLPREILKGRTWKDASRAAHADWSREHG